jgi:hypothetical protein
MSLSSASQLHSEGKAIDRAASCKYASPAASMSRSQLERELQLAQLKIRKLALDVEMSERIEGMKAEMLKEVQQMEEEEKSIMHSGSSRPPTPQPSERLDAVRHYVESLPA